MKFKYIKVGDTVYTEKEVMYGWSTSETFYIPEKVTRVTATQFVVESGDKYRKDGCKIGGYGDAYFLGDKAGLCYQDTVCDETEKMNLFQIKLSTENEIRNLLAGIRCRRNSELSLPELLEIKKILLNVKDAFKPRK